MPELRNPKFILLVFTRIFYLAYLIICFIAVPEVRKLLDSGFSDDGTTLYVPLKVCRPTNIEVDGETVSGEASDQCMDLDMLINACAASMIVSIVAVLLFVFVDTYVRCKRTHKHKGMVSGMGLFLSFILLQTAFTAGAVAKEADFYLDTYKDLLSAMNDDYFKDVKLHGNIAVIWTCTGAGFAVSVVAGVEALFRIYTACQRNNDKNTEDPQVDISKMESMAEPTLKPNSSPAASVDVENPFENPTEPSVAETPLGPEDPNKPSWLQ